MHRHKNMLISNGYSLPTHAQIYAYAHNLIQHMHAIYWQGLVNSITHTQMQNTCTHVNIYKCWVWSMSPFFHLSLRHTLSLWRSLWSSWVWLTQSISVRASLPSLCAGWSLTKWTWGLHFYGLNGVSSRGGDALGGSQDNFKTRHVLFLRCMSLSHLLYISCQVALSRTSMLNVAKRGGREGEREPNAPSFCLDPDSNTDQTGLGYEEDL